MKPFTDKGFQKMKYFILQPQLNFSYFEPATPQQFRLFFCYII
jgi:hypothetical protein